MTKLAAANCNRCNPFKGNSSALRKRLELRYHCSKQHLALNSRNKSYGFRDSLTAFSLLVNQNNSAHTPSYTEFSHCFVDQRGLLVPKRSCGSCNLNQYQSFFFQCDIIKLTLQSESNKNFCCKLKVDKRLVFFYYAAFKNFSRTSSKNISRLSFPIFNCQINLDNCVLVRCLLIISVKKND